MPCRYLVLAVFVTLAASMSAPAQPAPPEPVHALEEDVWALQFGISSQLTLGPGLGTTISAKHHSVPGRALRYGLTLRAAARDGGADSPIDERYHTTAGLTVEFVRYPMLSRRPSRAVQLYYGIGPTVGLRYDGRDSDDAARDIDRTRLTGGASAALGVEWFVTPRVSLGGEYRSTLVLSYDHETNAGGAYGVELAPQSPTAVLSVYL